MPMTMRFQFYRLEGHTPVPLESIAQWAEWFERADRTVSHNVVNGVEVSTVFLGLNHGFAHGPPLLFETMIFGGFHDGYQRRCSTWAEAENLHIEALTLVLRWKMLPSSAQRLLWALWWLPISLIRKAELLKVQMGG